MTLQVLVAAMNQQNTDLISEMNLQSDALIGNQCDRNAVEEYKIDGHDYVYYSLKERGVGNNRNTVLARSTADILTFADDDMKFVDNYDKIILKAFEEVPDADAMIFNIETIGQDIGRRQIKKIQRVHFWNFMNYGAARLSVKNNSIRRANIFFHREFGGGTRYSSGEDTLFIHDMLKKGLKIYTYPALIGSVNQETSTWFKGYNKKFFFDQGVFFRALSGKFGILLSLMMVLKNRKRYLSEEINFKTAVTEIQRGMKSFKNLETYSSEK